MKKKMITDDIQGEIWLKNWSNFHQIHKNFPTLVVISIEPIFPEYLMSQMSSQNITNYFKLKLSFGAKCNNVVFITT